MEHFVRFKRLTNDMSANDTRKILNTFLNEENDAVSVILDALWKKAYLENDACFMKKMNNIATQIKSDRMFDARDTDSAEKRLQIKPIKHIHDISAAMINVIGTFLEFKHLTQMECVDRTFFIALRSPLPALQYIYNTATLRDRKHWTTKYLEHCVQTDVQPDFSRFRNVRNLRVSGEDMPKMAAIVSNPAHIGNFKSVCDVVLYDITLDTLQLAMHSVFDPEIIKRLTLMINFDDENAEASILVDVLCRLKNVRVLSMQDMNTYGGVDAEFVSSFRSLMKSDRCCLPSLIRLTSDLDAGMNQCILASASTTLESLEFYGVVTPFYDELVQYSQCGPFNNLKDIRFSCSSSALARYLNEYGWSKMQNVSKLNLDISGDDDMSNALDLVFKKVNLSHVGLQFRTRSNASTYLSIIAEALKKYRRQSLTLCLSFGVSLHTAFDCHTSLLQLIDALKACVLGEFVFRCKNMDKACKVRVIQELPEDIECASADDSTGNFRCASIVVTPRDTNMQVN
mmetsp:Transcript_14689/g.22083  ORF Transcript_14689/g.22083 Transcript_14689/m.22083 type:complete len:513 (-) Transcript_14689:88-1626(-)